MISALPSESGSVPKNKKTIEFNLEGPFQAWGAPSGWDYRATGVPKPRGIAGMIGCCMGLRRGDPKLQQLENLQYDIDTIEPGNIVIDFQTIRPLHGDEHLPTASGKKRANDSDAVIVRKEYLTDAKFVVRVTGSEDIIDEIYEAMHDPYWVPYLGRACCPPSEPIIPKYIDEEEDKQCCS